MWEESALKQKLQKCRDRKRRVRVRPHRGAHRAGRAGRAALQPQHPGGGGALRRALQEQHHKGILREFTRAIDNLDLSDRGARTWAPLLGRIMRWFRPEVDRYYVTDTPVTG
jgi:hypothetical protein